MENMASIIQSLSGNPMTTPIGQKIEQATDPSLPSEDWNLMMIICDMINDTDEGPKDCVRAIRRRLQNAGKNHKVIMYTLTVLETCVKNCGRRLHLLVTNKDFVQELVKLIGPKNDPPLILQTKVLSIIQDWANAFRGQPDLAGVVHVYNDLKSKSIEFPPTNYECQVPINTPQRSIKIQPPPNHMPINYQQSLGINPNQLPTNPVQIYENTNLNFPVLSRMTGPIVLNEEQLSKLKSELDVVNGNVKIFDEMLTELHKSSNNLQTEDLELLHELNATCLQMQKRIVELLDRISNEEVTSELLTINDNLNTLFSRYEIYLSKSNLRTDNSDLNNSTNQQQKQTQEASLIDLRDSRESNQLANQLENLQLGAVGGGPTNAMQGNIVPNNGPKSTNGKLNQSSPQQKQKTKSQSGDTDFDEFAQLRSEKKVFDGIELPNEQEADEMERWLKEQNSEAPQSLSNTEFEKFLEQRFNNLEKQPSKKGDDKDLLDL